MKALDDIHSLLDSMRDRKAEMNAFEGLLTEISSALADILAHMEKSGNAASNTAADKPTDAALSKAIEGLSKTLAKQFDNSATAKPTPVHVNVPKADAPTINVMPHDWKSLRITVGKPAPDGTKEFTITKT